MPVRPPSHRVWVYSHRWDEWTPVFAGCLSWSERRAEVMARRLSGLRVDVRVEPIDWRPRDLAAQPKGVAT